MLGRHNLSGESLALAVSNSERRAVFITAFGETATECLKQSKQLQGYVEIHFAK